MLKSSADIYQGQVFELNKDQQAVALRELQDSIFGYQAMAEYVAKNKDIPRDFVYNVLYLAEAKLVDLAKMCGVELDSAQAREDRYTSLRQANLKVANLERQLGQATTPASVLPAVSALCDKVRAWWGSDGFGYVSEASIGPYGMSVKLSCYLMHGRILGSKTPVSDKQSKADWLQSLKDRGFELVYPKGDDPMIAATTENQALLEALVLKAFPSARFHTFTAVMRAADDDGQPRNALREFEIFLPRMDEVAALPELPEHE